MTRKLAVPAAMLVVLASCGGDDSNADPITPDPGSAPIVSMPGFTFSPFTTTISVGGTVVFDFPSEPHNVIFERKTGAPTDIQVTANRSVSRVFRVAGTFPYDCTIHPGMSGEVVVR